MERYQIHHGFNVVLGDDVWGDGKTPKPTFVTRDNVDEVVARMTEPQLKSYVDRGYLSIVPGAQAEAVGAVDANEASQTRTAAKAARGSR